ncbi:MAG: hypothetical protein HC821_01000 [Lewinella sp.]|nr:hypothetical protein [Lewinella sp.]
MTPPSARLLPQTITACWNERRRLEVELQGQPPFNLTFRRGGNVAETITFEQSGLQSWEISLGGRYELLSVRDQACLGPVSGSVDANFYRPVINPRITNPQCADSRDGSIAIQHLPSRPPYIYRWTGAKRCGFAGQQPRSRRLFFSSN